MKLGNFYVSPNSRAVLGSSIMGHDSRMKSTLNSLYKESLPIVPLIYPPDSVIDTKDSEKIHFPQSLGQEYIAPFDWTLFTALK